MLAVAGRTIGRVPNYLLLAGTKIPHDWLQSIAAKWVRTRRIQSVWRRNEGGEVTSTLTHVRHT